MSLSCWLHGIPVQIYATSCLFGYFLRRVDKRFQLERTLGTLPETRQDTVARLERLFALADAQVPGCRSRCPKPLAVLCGQAWPGLHACRRSRHWMRHPRPATAV